MEHVEKSIDRGSAKVIVLGRYKSKIFNTIFTGTLLKRYFQIFINKSTISKPSTKRLKVPSKKGMYILKIYFANFIISIFLSLHNKK